MWPAMAEGRSACCEALEGVCIVELCAATACKTSVCDDRSPVVH